jgi:hypothetical protein
VVAEGEDGPLPSRSFGLASPKANAASTEKRDENREPISVVAMSLSAAP